MSSFISASYKTTKPRKPERKNVMLCPKGEGSQQEDNKSVFSALLYIVQEEKELFLDTMKASLVKEVAYEPA